MEEKMNTLNFPAYYFKLKPAEGFQLIFDELRKKYIRLTPEEWVRQHLIRYLIEEKYYPKGLISIEGGIKVNTLSRRYDAVVYSRNRAPLVLIECKAPSVKISQATFDQAFAYNTQVHAKYILISNGIQHFCCMLNEANKHSFLREIPAYDDL